MNKVAELYQKVASDSVLQAEFGKIMSDAEKAGKDETEVKLAAFAAKAGYAVSFKEVQEYINGMQTAGGELTDLELDAVAGGKSDNGVMAVGLSILSLGVGCAIASIVGAFVAAAQGCADTFQ